MPTTISDVVHNAHGIDVDTLHFGIEIEVENARQPRDLEASLWTTVHDGSLRDGGCEFLSQRPMTKAEVEEQVPWFYRWFDQHSFTNGIRTSTHVHANVMGKTGPQVAAICTLYTLVEPLLFRYCGPVREQNIYCVPWYRATDELEYVKYIAEGSWSYLHNPCKYSALYLEPLMRFGTLEFRMAPVFDNAGALLTWVDIIERVVENGFETSEEVLAAFRELPSDEFVEGIFGEQLAGVLRGACQADFDELFEQYDVETNAELSCCTYNENAVVNGWFTPSFTTEGTGTTGYHREVRRPRMRIEPDYEPDYDPGEEYYDDEEDY
jgi:hypothetical protein